MEICNFADVVDKSGPVVFYYQAWKTGYEFVVEYLFTGKSINNSFRDMKSNTERTRDNEHDELVSLREGHLAT